MTPRLSKEFHYLPTADLLYASAAAPGKTPGAAACVLA